VFIAKCLAGDESEVKSMVERNPGFLNQQDSYGATGLMAALYNERHSLSRWLLSLPGLDTKLRDEFNYTALHRACHSGAPLDIVITLVRLSSWETVNMKDRYGGTVLDWAVQSNNTSAVLYLSWLGAECREEYRKYKYREITLQTWTSQFSKLDALCWSIAANITDLRLLSPMPHVEQDKDKLRSLARIFNRHGVCRMWGDLSSLQNLAWEKAWLSCPALHPDHRPWWGQAFNTPPRRPRPDVVLPDFTAALFRKTVRHCYKTRQYCIVL